MFGNVSVKSRPLRLAFLIEPNNEALRGAIEINSSLWGGNFNPVIPIYRRPPKHWREYPGQKNSVKDRVLGYIRAFDPDILVNCTSAELPTYIRDLQRLTIKIDEIWGKYPSAQHDGTPQYGVGIFELLNAIYKELFEVKRRFPSKVILPILPRTNNLFWMSVLGCLPTAIQAEVEKNYSEAIDIEKPEASASSLSSILKPNLLSPRQITRHGLKTEGNRGRFKDSFCLLMDAGNFADIVDYWNLRALGRSVLPIPKQFVETPEYLELVRDFIKSRYRVSPHNPSVTYGTSIVRGSSSTMAELEALANKLDLKSLIPDQPNAHTVSLQHWYPRIWDEWAMGKDGATPDTIVAATEEFPFQNTDGDVSFPIVRPEFIADHLSETPRFANEIYPKFYSQGGETLANVLPYDHGKEVLRAVGGLSIHADEFRIGRTGLIHFVRWGVDTRWKVPSAEKVFLAWLKDKGFEAKLSSCGRLAKELYAQLRGWTSVLTHEELLKLLEKMNRGGEEGKGMPLPEVKNRLGTISPEGDLYTALVERRVFQLGYKTQCVHCLRASWHDLKSFATQLVCPLCHKELDAISAVDSANHGIWHLKTAGAFSLSNYGEGSYTVLLLQRFFERDSSLQDTEIVSFSAKDSAGKEIEADYGLMWRDTVFGETYDGMLFAECKSYNQFEDRDFQRMRTLAKRFPGAILTFATLRKTLEPREIKQIRRIYDAGMKRWKTDRPLNPVLLLTGNELFSVTGPPYCWDGMAVPDWAKRPNGILRLCNSTQAIYLGVPHWDHTWQSQYEKKKARKAKRRGH